MWCVTVNRPGYLPDNDEPAETFSDWREARNAMVGELSVTYQQSPDETVTDRDLHAHENLALQIADGEEGSVMWLGYAHNLQRVA